jgi:hypothetical protein
MIMSYVEQLINTALVHTYACYVSGVGNCAVTSATLTDFVVRNSSGQYYLYDYRSSAASQLRISDDGFTGTLGAASATASLLESLMDASIATGLPLEGAIDSQVVIAYDDDYLYGRVENSPPDPDIYRVWSRASLSLHQSSPF